MKTKLKTKNEAKSETKTKLSSTVQPKKNRKELKELRARYNLFLFLLKFDNSNYSKLTKRQFKIKNFEDMWNLLGNLDCLGFPGSYKKLNEKHNELKEKLNSKLWSMLDGNGKIEEIQPFVWKKVA
ncbi:hypothetical protein EHR02_00015 [Leptospira levettii]|uniref:hypothetical protein n=1 Tax=Leptospira levettii TaxID=2023178 RepID=UPI0010835F9C|nr:hypothetical protein [Leptospira levettii]TGM95022.1 hypothetical protein EHR02_00015 [Leptospira levettii]